MSLPISSCPRGSFFDGNENFGGPPYRGFITLLCVAPLLFLIGSLLWWIISIRRQRQSVPASAIQNGVITSSAAEQSNYQTMNDGPTNNSNTNNDLNADDHPVIDDSLYNYEPSSPYTSSAVGPAQSPSPTASPSPSLDSASSSNSVSLLSAPAPSQATLSSTTSASSSSSSFMLDSSAVPSDSSPVSKHTQFLLFLRSLIRPSPLFASTAVVSSLQFAVTLCTLIYALLKGEQCCYGGTGALYAILCLRLFLSYSNIRVGYWQTHSRSSTISVVEKSCQIGYLIHYVWLSFAFILVNDDGQCQATAPVMYTVSLVSIVLLLINYCIFGLFSVIHYFSKSSSDLMIVLSRTCIKLCMIGWSYGRELDLHDAITDIEMEIACLPCITYDDMVIREKEKKRRRELYECEKSGNLTVKIDSMKPEEKSSHHEECEALSCAICISAYETTDMIRPLPCGHHLHKSCSDSWLKVKSTCPLCVRSVLVQ